MLLDEDTSAMVLQSGLLKNFFILPPQTDKVAPLLTFLRRIVEEDWLVDEIGKVEGLETLSKSVLQHLSPDCVSGIRNVLANGGSKTRMQFCHGNTALIEAMRKLLPVRDASTSAAGVILSISSYYSKADTEHAIAEAKKVIFDNVRGDYIPFRYNALDILMEAAVMQEQRDVLMSLGIKELLQPFIDNPNADEFFLACIINALLSANDVSETSATGTKPTSPVVIRRIIAALTETSKTSSTGVTTVKGFTAGVRVLLVALRSLATNEANLSELRSQDIVAVITGLITARKQIFLKNMEWLEEV